MAGAAFDMMRDLSGSAIGSLVAAVWQGALLAGAAALGLRLLPKTPAAVRFAIWFAVFVVVGALPFASLWIEPAAGSGAGLATRTPWLTVSAGWSEAVLAFWLLMSLVRAASLIVAAVRVRSLWSRATPIKVAPSEVAVEDLLGRKTEICISDEVERPSVIGFFSPRVLIPGWLMEKMTPEEMEQVVLHEVGHLRRADDWLNLLQKLALVLFPLNPTLAWVERRLCFERELACDEQVLEVTGAPKAYASCLASLAEHRMTRSSIALMMGALGRESELGQRVRRILVWREPIRPAQMRLLVGGALCALLAGAAGLEHCPQLVGFRGGDIETGARMQAANRAGYNAVVFRPEESGLLRARAVDTGMHQSLTFHGSEKQREHLRVASETSSEPIGVRAVTKSRGRQTQARVIDAVSRDVAARQSGPSAVGTEWMVLTSWTTDSSEYGTRVVMTSIAASPFGQPSANATVPVREPSQDAEGMVRARTILATQFVPNVRQTSPFAAVPFHGGWLFIQL